MRTFIKYIVSVIIISIVSYSLQVLWVKIVEPIMESNVSCFRVFCRRDRLLAELLLY